MTIEQLRFFIAAASLESFSRAAEQEFTTQSTISKQISSLEKELGVQLFRRSNRRIQLNEMGKILFNDAVTIIDKVQTMFTHAEQFTSENSARIRIFSLPFVSQYNLRIAIKKFLESHPTMNVEVFEVEERELFRQLDMCGGDLFILRDNIPIEGKHQTVNITTDELALYVPSDHILAEQKSVSIEMLKNEQFVLMHDYTSIFQLCVKSFADAGIKPHIYNTARLDSIFGAIASGEAVSLLMTKNTNIFMLRGISVIPIRPRIESNVIGVIPPLANNKQMVLEITKLMAEYAI
jgi:DNA-binding transcriptional LysR family regulator